MKVTLALPAGSAREGTGVKFDGPVVQLLGKNMELLFAYCLAPGEYVVRTQKDGTSHYEVIR